ncbi:MAG: c-type cytochrome [Hyphomicrobiales bacterium]
MKPSSGKCLKRVILVLAALCAGLFAPAAQARDWVGHGGPVKSVAISPDGAHALSGSFDYSMIYWDISKENPEVVTRFDDHEAAVNSVAFLPGGKRAITASDDGNVALWDLQNGKLIKRFNGHTHKVVKIALSSDGGKAVSAAWDRTARIWNLNEQTAGPVLKGHSNTINDAAFSQSGKFVFTAGYDGAIRQWHTDDGSLERIIYKHGWGVNVLRVLPGDKEILFGTLDGFVGVLDIFRGEVTTILRPYERPVLSLVVDPALDMAAVGGGDGRITVWELSTWREKYVHENPYGPVWALAFAKDGKHVYYAGLDDNVHHWQLEPLKPFELAKGQIPRRFQLKDGIGLGARQFARKCSVCHTLTAEGANRAGPTLYKLFGRKVGTVKGYNYSPALTGKNFEWNEETIGQLFAIGPENFAPGTKMPLQKMSNAKERNALIAFLKKASETGKPAEDAYTRFGHIESLGGSQ